MAENEEERRFMCSQCGQWHDELLTDMGFQLPDAVWGLEYLEKYKRSVFNKDLCTLDGARYFLRTVLCVPFSYKEGYFGWGLWVEVEKRYHDLCLETFYEGADEIPAFPGVIANNIKNYPPLMGEKVMVKLFNEHRPFIEFVSGSTHVLAVEQREYISLARHHEIAEQYT